MPRLKFIWDKEEEKEEEKSGWLNRTRGIGELPELPISTKLKFTADVGLGVGAKATGGISLPGTTPIKPSEQEDILSNLLNTMEDYKKQISKLEDIAKERSFVEVELRNYRYAIGQYNKAVNRYNEILKKPETIEKPEYKPLIEGLPISKPEDKPVGLFQDPEMIEAHKANFESWRLWLKELKETKDKVAFLKGEGHSPELIEAQKKSDELLPYMYGEKGGKWLNTIAISLYSMGLGYQLADALVSSGFKVKGVKFNAKQIEDLVKRAYNASDPETGKITSALSDNDYYALKQINQFLKTTGRSPAARSMLEKIVEQTGGLKLQQQVNIFGTKLYAGLPADEIAKSIVAVGKVTADMVQGLDPVKVSQVTQALLNTSPALASAFLKAVEKPEVIPKVEVKEEVVPKAKVKEPWQMTKKEYIGDTIWIESAKNEHIQSVIQAVREGKPVPAEVLADYPDLKAAPKPPTAIEPVPTEAIKAKEPAPKEEVGKVDIRPFAKLLDLDKLANDIYEIKPSDRAKGTYDIFFKGTDRLASKAVSVDINTAKTVIDNRITDKIRKIFKGEKTFKEGEIKLRETFKEYLKAEVKPPTKIELPEKQTIPTTLAEAKEILKVDPKKPSIPKDMLAKEMIAKKVSLIDIEAVKGEKIDVSKPKDIIIALRDVKAVKKEVVAEPTPKVAPVFQKFKENIRDSFGVVIGENPDSTITFYSPTPTPEIIVGAKGKSEAQKIGESLHEIGHLTTMDEGTYFPELMGRDKFLATELDAYKWAIDNSSKFGMNPEMVMDIMPESFKDKYSEEIEQYLQIKVKKAEAVTEQPAAVEAPVAEKATAVLAKAEVKVEPTKPPIPPSPPTKAEMAGEPIGDPIARLNELIKQAKPRRGRLETEYTKERARRIAEVERAIDEIGGEKGYIVALSKLKGKLVPTSKYLFEPIKDKLSQPEIDALYNRTFKHPYLDEWEKISAANELTKILSGELPTPKGLVLLEEIYGTDLIKNILSKRALGLKVADVLIDIANIPRAILATADMSAFLRQGVVYVVSHPVIAAKAMGKTFKFAFSPKSFEQYFKDLPKDKLYPLMRKSGLAITDPSRALATGREEAFISRLMQQIPIIGQVIKFAERAYVGFLNKLRVDVFKTFADEFLSKGYSPVKDKDLFKATAEVVNTFTGRGSMGNLNRITPFLNTIFFSPRLITARFNALNPIWYARQPKEIRVKALGDFAKFVAAGLTLLAIIKASSLGDVETDPRSSDFGKIKIGNTRWDIWGGFQQWVRVFSQFVTGKRKNTATGEIISLSKDEYPFTTRKEVLLRFVEGKLAPVPALINELISGAKTFEGEDITFETVVRKKFIMMYIQDIADAYADGGMGRAVGAGIPAFFGVGVQTWGEKKSKEPLKITIPKSGKLKFTKPKLNIKSTKLKFNF